MGAGKTGENPALSRSGDRGRKPLRAVALKNCGSLKRHWRRKGAGKARRVE